jgi:hypothetical protein
VARITGLDLKMIANWTDRGFADPYQGQWDWRRGRGRARRYTLRDILRFVLMRDLTERYAIPVPLGRRICGAVFSEAFSPEHLGYLVVERVRAEHIVTHWFGDETALAAHLRQDPRKSCLIVNTGATFASATAVLEKLSAEADPRQGGN